MHRSEELEHVDCAVCRAEVAASERVFPFGDDEVLCFRCAVARHGVYDEQRDRWVVSPEVDDLRSPPA
jgi:hypothetical protein